MSDDSESLLRLFPAYEKRAWRPVFPDQAGASREPKPPFKLEANWEEAYFDSAKRLIQGVAKGDGVPGIEGVAGLYLFRHYLELGLKFLIFHSRWLENAEKLAAREAIENVKNTHSLGQLWEMAQKECRRIIPKDVWRSHDIPFLAACIAEFDAVDPHPGTTFRYHGEVFGVEKDPEKLQQAAHTIIHDSYIDFEQLAASMQHVFDVLNSLDVYVYETHGQLADWESEWQRDISEY
jgi:hypothetical protein